jgi:hypothetical protein
MQWSLHQTKSVAHLSPNELRHKYRWIVANTYLHEDASVHVSPLHARLSLSIHCSLGGSWVGCDRQQIFFIFFLQLFVAQVLVYADRYSGLLFNTTPNRLRPILLLLG